MSLVSSNFQKMILIQTESHSSSLQRNIFVSHIESQRSKITFMFKYFIGRNKSFSIENQNFDRLEWEASLRLFMNSMKESYGLTRVVTFNEDAKLLSDYALNESIRSSYTDKSVYKEFAVRSIAEDSQVFKYKEIKLKNGNLEHRFFLTLLIENEFNGELLCILLEINSHSLLKNFSRFYGHSSRLEIGKKAKNDLYDYRDGNKYFIDRTSLVAESSFPSDAKIISRIESSELSTILQSEKKKIIYLSLILVLITIICLLYITYLYLHPMKKVLKIIEDVKQSDYERKDVFNGNSEIDELGLQLQEMLQVIDDSIIERKNLLESRTNFFSSMSHDLRTPLNGISVATQLILDDKSLNKENQSLLVSIDTSSKLLLDLVNAILDLSSLKAGKMTLHEDNYSFKTAIQEVKTITDLLIIGKTDLAIKYHINLDDIDRVHGDKLRLKQVLTNILSNAVKFTKKGTIVIEAWQEPCFTSGYDKICFSISDTGIGMSDNVLDCIFEDFSQGNTDETKKIKGTGLGLAVVKKLLTLMDGTITVNSQIGIGSIFRFNLLIKKAHIHEDIPLANQSLALPFSTEFAVIYPLKIHIVEDNLINMKVANLTLKKLGYSVSESNNGLELMDDLNTNPIDLILMDCKMPKNGRL